MKVSETAKLEFYVSPTGNDAWDGLTPASNSPNAASGPFRTLTRAGEAVKAVAALTPRRRIEVFLRGGTYFLDAPWTLSPEFSGTSECPVIFAAYPGEIPIISGGTPITRWQQGEANGKPCWVADLPAVRDGKWFFSQLFVDGQRRHPTRLPKTGYYRFKGLGDQGNSGMNWGNGPLYAEYFPGELKEWQNPSDVKIVAQQLWFEMHHRIKHLDIAKGTVHFQTRCLGSLIDEKNEFARYYVENVFEALADPGDWYLDRAAGKLYYLPLAGESWETTQVIASRLDRVLHVAGSADAPLRHVRFENLRFQHADWTPPADWCGSVQAAFHVPGALLLDHAEYCVLYGCSVRHVAQYAIEVGTGCHENRIVACEMTDMGGGGVRINHQWLSPHDATVGDALSKATAPSLPSATTVSDCHIYDGTKIYHSAIGVFVGNAGHNRILHNHVHHMHYTGVSLGWSWGYQDQSTVLNRVEFNHIHHINWESYFSDNGGIYTLGVQPGGRIHNNLIHDVCSYGYGGDGIYPDEGSSDLIIENNVTYRIRHAGYSGHYGQDLIVRNNIFALAELNHVCPGLQENHRTAIFERNIVLWDQGVLGSSGSKLSGWPIHSSIFRDNLLWASGQPIIFQDGTTLADWQAIGQFANTIVADPGFDAPEDGVFTFPSNSPAIGMGFVPIDLSKVGPRICQGVRPASYDAWPADEFPPRAVIRTTLEWIEPGRSGRVTVRNWGTRNATGAIRLSASPVGMVSVHSTETVSFADLPPQASVSAEFRLACSVDPNSLPEVLVQSHPQGDAEIPGLLRYVPDRWHIPTVPPQCADSPEFILPDSVPMRRFLDPLHREYGTVRLAATKENLLLDARIIESHIAVDAKQLWTQSALEVFLIPVPTQHRSGITQFAFLPPLEATEQQKAQAGQTLQTAEEGYAPLSEAFAIHIETTPQGYRVRAVIPKARFGVFPDAREFLFEAAICGHFKLPEHHQRVTLFTAVKPFQSSTGCGRVILDD